MAERARGVESSQHKNRKVKFRIHSAEDWILVHVAALTWTEQEIWNTCIPFAFASRVFFCICFGGFGQSQLYPLDSSFFLSLFSVLVCVVVEHFIGFHFNCNPSRAHWVSAFFIVRIDTQCHTRDWQTQSRCRTRRGRSSCADASERRWKKP